MMPNVKGLTNVWRELDKKNVYAYDLQKEIQTKRDGERESNFKCCYMIMTSISVVFCFIDFFINIVSFEEKHSCMSVLSS